MKDNNSPKYTGEDLMQDLQDFFGHVWVVIAVIGAAIYIVSILQSL